MSKNTLTVPALPPNAEVFGMPVGPMAEVAARAGNLATKLFDVDIPKGVDPAQVVYAAAAAVPDLWAIKRGQPVPPARIQGHIDNAVFLQQKLRGADLPANFLGPVNDVLNAAAGANPAEVPARIRAALGSPAAQASLAKVEPYLAAAEQFRVGPQLEAELIAAATRVRDVVRANAGSRTSPDILARTLYSVAGDVLGGRAPLPMLRAYLGVQFARSGAGFSLPPYEKIETKLKAGAAPIMEAVDAALPPDQRDPVFIDSLRTSAVGKVGALSGGMRAIRNDVEPLLRNLVAMMPRDAAASRRELQDLFSPAE